MPKVLDFHGVQTRFIERLDTPIAMLNPSIVGVVGWGEGADDKEFPLDTPVLVNSRAQIAKMGKGSLAQAHNEMWGQTSLVTVVVRVAHDADKNKLKANLIGKLDNDTGKMTGMKALYRAENDAGVDPKIIICPNINHLSIAKDVGLELEKFSKRGAMPIVEVAGQGLADWKNFASSFSDAYLIAGGVKYFDAVKEKDVVTGGSAVAAAIMVRTDNEKGFQHSPSNHKAYGIKSNGASIDYSPASKTTLSHLLNESSINCFVSKQGGCYLWGNRIADGKFVQHVRTNQTIANSINTGIQAFTDRNITVRFMDDFKQKIRNTLRLLKMNEVITGGEVEIEHDKNKVAVGTGKFYARYDLGLFDCAENIILTYEINKEYTREIYKD